MAGLSSSTQSDPGAPSRVHRDPRSQSKRRYTVNARLLLISFIVLLVAIPSCYLWYQYQLRRTATQLMARAEQLEAEGEWAQAAAYYQRYLTIQPEDTEALVKLVQTLSQAETNPARLPRINNLIYRALGRSPERHDLRRMLAENLITIGAFDEARREAHLLLEKSPENAVTARRVIALAQFAQADPDRPDAIGEALQTLLAASAESPGETQLIEVTANALRENPAAVDLQDGDAATRADQLMDRLIETHSDVPARLARYRYRTRFKLPNAAADLQAALQLEPDNPEALLLAAMEATQGGANEDAVTSARGQLRRVIEVAPRDPRAYLALAMLSERAGQRDEAIQVLKQGQAAAGETFDLGVALANLQTMANDLESAAATLEELESQRASFFVRLSSADRAQAENRLRLLRARLAVASGEPRQAVPWLQSILATSDVSQGGQGGNEALQATALLAQVSGNSGRWDQASAYWRSLVQTGQVDANMMGSAVDAFLRSGEFQEAVDAIDNFTLRSPVTQDLLLQRVQAHLGLQLGRTPEARNWTEFETALRDAKSQLENRWQLLFAELAYLRAQPDGKSAAIAMLRSSEEAFEDEVDFWRNAARTYRDLGERQDAERAVAQHQRLAPSPVDHARLQMALLVADGQFDQADQLLAALQASLPADQQLQVGRMRVELLSSGGKQSEALAVAKLLLKPETEDAGLMAVATDIALGLGELETAETWEGWLRKATGNGPDARFLRARRMLLSFDQLDLAAKQQLGREIVELRGERPRWFPVLALAGRLAQLQGDSRQALSDYRMAVEMGDRRPFTLQQLTLLLYEFGLQDEAQRYLTQLSSEPSANPFLDALAIELAVQQAQPEVAIQLARESLQRFPEDPLRHLFLADLLARHGESQQALEVLQEATRKFGSDPRVWMGWVTTLVRAGQTDRAREIVSSLDAHAELSPDNRYQVAAQGYELLGDAAHASEQYQLALELQPTAVPIRLRYARLLSGSDPTAARTQLELVLQQEPGNQEARRDLAVLLAATGQESDWNRATQLLQTSMGDSVPNTSTNDRMRAMLLSRRGRTRSERLANCQSARRILQQRLEKDAGEARELNQLLLAQILEQEADLSQDSGLLVEAHDQLRSVVDTGPPNAEQLSRYIEFLLRRGRSAASANSEEPASTDSALTDNVRQDFLQAAGARLEDLKRMQTSADDGLGALVTALHAELLQAQGRREDALQLVREFVAEHTGSGVPQGNAAQRYLAAGRLFSRIGAHSDAETWYRRVMELSPSAYVLVVQSLVDQGRRKEAADFCLELSGGQLTPEMAITLAQVMTLRGEAADDLAEARLAVQTAVERYTDNVALLQAEAVLRASQGEYEQAIALFRRVVQREPNNALALNNLATLLAETPNQRAEALQAIERAIEIVGRQAPLLDTKGTIHLKLADHTEAIACLEEATAGGATDARYYLHLAAAYQQVGRIDEAKVMLREARDFGLERFVLTEGDREMLQSLENTPTPPASATPASTDAS